MSALDDLKAASARNELGVAHVAEVLKEASDKITALMATPAEDPIDEVELEAIAKGLSEQADLLAGMTLVPPQTSGVPGAQTSNGSPSDPVPSATSVSTPSDPSPLPDDANVAPPSNER